MTQRTQRCERRLGGGEENSKQTGENSGIKKRHQVAAGQGREIKYVVSGPKIECALLLLKQDGHVIMG
jgi:hypothetical protein